jgi:beta-lactamase class D OXA-2
MTTRTFALLLTSLILVAYAHAQDDASERSDWEKFFSDFQAKGTILIADERQAGRVLLVFNQERAAKRYSPASTFKIPHTLFALDAGVVLDEFQVFRWDGIERSFAGHNQDQDLRSAMRNSALWLYEQFAEEIGEEKAAEYLEKIDYGNADHFTPRGSYWVDGSLEISAHEQISFLRKLFHNKLPFPVEHQRLVKDLMITEAGRNWILRAKTGWEGQYGWWVGWVEWPAGPVFFALNIDTPNRTDDLFKRQAIVRAVLHSIDVLPPNEIPAGKKSSESDLQRESPSECFSESPSMQRIILRGILNQRSYFSDFMRSSGYDRIAQKDVRLLTNDNDRSVCRRLNGLNSEKIHATQSRRGADYASDAPNFEVAYYQVVDLYVTIIAEAAPVSAREDMDIVRVGSGQILITAYSSDLEKVWSNARR